jgi:hypothetical protein
MTGNVGEIGAKKPLFLGLLRFCEHKPDFAATIPHDAIEKGL